jgi:hypothetical protein
MPLLAALALIASASSNPPHVRAESIDTQQFIAEASDRSPIVRAQIERLEQSDVIAYVRFVAFSDPTLEARVGFISRAGGRRYVAIEIACARLRSLQIAALAHELQHVSEIAAAPDVVDTATLAKHYEQIGMRMTDAWRHRTFETLAAIDIAARVRREITGGVVRMTEDR